MIKKIISVILIISMLTACSATSGNSLGVAATITEIPVVEETGLISWYDSYFEQEADIEKILEDRINYWNVVVANSELSYYVQGQEWGEDRLKVAFSKVKLPDTLTVPALSYIEVGDHDHSDEGSEGEHLIDGIDVHSEEFLNGTLTVEMDMTPYKSLLEEEWNLENTGKIGEALFYVQNYSPDRPDTLSFDYMHEYALDMKEFEENPMKLEQVKNNLIKSSLEAQCDFLESLLDTSFSQSMTLALDYVTSVNIDMMGLQAYMNYFTGNPNTSELKDVNIKYRNKYFPLIENIQEVILSEKAPERAKIRDLSYQCKELADELSYTDMYLKSNQSSTKLEELSKEDKDKLLLQYLRVRMFRQFSYENINYIMPSLFPAKERVMEILHLFSNAPTEQGLKTVEQYIETGNPVGFDTISSEVFRLNYSDTAFRNMSYTKNSYLSKMFKAQNVSYSNMQESIKEYSKIMESSLYNYADALDFYRGMPNQQDRLEAAKRMIDAESVILSALAHMRWSMSLDETNPATQTLVKEFCDGAIETMLKTTNEVLIDNKFPEITGDDIRLLCAQKQWMEELTEWTTKAQAEG